jgi:uncharacterized protein YbjT (DUF2867 family)
MKVLVIGATGNVGSQVIRSLGERGVAARAFVRDAERAAGMLGSDVELAVGDLADRDSIDRALHGVDRLFLACGNVPGQVGFECAAIDAARAAGLTRVVKLSSPDPGVDAPLIFDRWHGEIERHLLGSGLATVLLRPRTYMTNLLAYAQTIRQTGRLFAPAGSARISFVDPVDVGAAAAAALVEDGLDRAAYTLTGPEAIGFDRIARELTELAAAGDRIEYVDIPDDAARVALLDAGLPEFVADFIVGVFRSQRAGTMSATNDAVRALTGREPRSIGQFLREHEAAFGLRADNERAAVGATPA